MTRNGHVHPCARIWARMQDADSVVSTIHDGQHIVRWDLTDGCEHYISPTTKHDRVKLHEVEVNDEFVQAWVYVDGPKECHPFRRLVTERTSGGWRAWNWRNQKGSEA